MKILVVADVHGHGQAIPRTRQQLRALEADLLIVCGDISHFGRPEGFIEEFFEGLEVPGLAVPGNCDPRSSVEVLEDLGVSLHGRRRRVGDATFAGLGGSNPTPFGTPFEVPEEEIYGGLQEVMDYDTNLVTHAPPLGHVDVIPRTVLHAGSSGVARVVEEYSPSLVLCGHIHEGRGAEVTGGTTFVNPGPAKDGFSALIKLGEGTTEVELLSARGLGSKH
jgi:hypothetical protein